MLLEAWANRGKWLWDGLSARPMQFRGVADGLVMPNASSLRIVMSPTKLPKDETSDRRKRFLAAETTKVQCAILIMHTTDGRMGERNSYTGNRPCTKKRLVRHHDRGRPGKFTSDGKMSQTVDRGGNPLCSTCHDKAGGEGEPTNTPYFRDRLET